MTSSRGRTSDGGRELLKEKEAAPLSHEGIHGGNNVVCRFVRVVERCFFSFTRRWIGWIFGGGRFLRGMPPRGASGHGRAQSTPCHGFHLIFLRSTPLRFPSDITLLRFLLAAHRVAVVSATAIKSCRFCGMADGKVAADLAEPQLLIGGREEPQLLVGGDQQRHPADDPGRMRRGKSWRRIADSGKIRRRAREGFTICHSTESTSLISNGNSSEVTRDKLVVDVSAWGAGESKTDKVSINNSGYALLIKTDEVHISSNPAIVCMVKEMQEKFDKYWKEWYLTNCIPIIPDPRYKYDYIDFRLKMAFGIH